MLLALGDSFSYGAELSDMPSTTAGMFGNDRWCNQTYQSFPMPPSQLAWPSLLAQQLGTTVANHSLIGDSNDRIYRKAMIESCRLPHSLVVCGWTALARFDISYQGQDCPVSYGNSKFSWVRDFVTYHYNHELMLERHLSHLISLQNHFKLTQQPYVFFNHVRDYDFGKYQFMLDQLDTSCYINFGSSVVEDYQGWPHGAHGHALEAVHQDLAHKLYNFVQHKYFN